MALNKIALCSRALAKIGAEPIFSFEDGTAESDTASLLYESVRDDLLSIHPWSFATGTVTLARLSAVPVADFDYAFQLPTDFLRALSVGNSQHGRSLGVPFRILEDRIHTDAPTVALTYIFKAPEESWPPFFDMAIITRLAGEFALPLTENTQRAELMAREAELAFRRAKLVDSQQQTPRALHGFSLISCRR